jgi:hypothetical protein
LKRERRRRRRRRRRKSISEKTRQHKRDCA